MNDVIEVGLVSKTYFNITYWIAIAQGFFLDVGIEPRTTMYGKASQVPPLLDGSLKLVLGTTEATLHNAATGGPLRLIAGNTGKLVHSLIARPQFKRVEDLRGATIGILNMTEGTFFHVKAMLAAHGLRYPQDYNVVETGGVPPRHTALIDGTIDAGLQSIPWNYVAEDAGLNNLGEAIDYIPDWQFVSINANTDWATRNADLVERFLRAMIQATDWYYANREAASAVAARELPTPMPHALRAWDHYTGTNAMTRNVSINLTGLKTVVEMLLAESLLPADAPTNLDFYIAEEFLARAKV